MENRNLMMKDMIGKQVAFDSLVAEKQEDTQNIFTKKVLAFAVEVGEMANESRTFKYWVENPTPRLATFREEAADVLHFLISIGLDVEPDLFDEVDSGLDVAFNFSQYRIQDDDPSDLILELMQDTILFTRKEAETLDFWLTLGKFLAVVSFFGISFEDLYGAYLHKNAINFERQASGY